MSESAPAGGHVRPPAPPLRASAAPSRAHPVMNRAVEPPTAPPSAACRQLARRPERRSIWPARLSTSTDAACKAPPRSAGGRTWSPKASPRRLGQKLGWQEEKRLM